MKVVMAYTLDDIKEVYEGFWTGESWYIKELDHFFHLPYLIIMKNGESVNSYGPQDAIDWLNKNETN